VLAADGTGDYTAWDTLAATLVAGDTVFVKPGTYSMSVGLSSLADIHIVGHNRSSVIFNMTAEVVFSSCDRLKLKSFRVNTGNYRLWAYGDDHIMDDLYCNSAPASPDGAQTVVFNGANATVMNSIFTTTGIGTQTTLCQADGRIFGCKFYAPGGYNQSTGTLRLSGSIFGCFFLLLDGAGSTRTLITLSPSSTLRGNYIYGNLNSGPVIAVQSDCVVDGNIIQDCRSLLYFVPGSNRVHITNNLITGAIFGYGYGIDSLDNPSGTDILFANNRFKMFDSSSSSASVLFLNTMDYVRVVNNVFEGGYTQIQNSSNGNYLMLTGNVFRGAGAGGVLADSGTNTIFSGNVGL
jgi:hypothetical protein